MRQKSPLLPLAVTEANKRLGERIRRARKVHKLTLLDLENRCRIHHTTIGRLERGDAGVSLGVFLTVLHSLEELSDIELILTQPEKPKHKRGCAIPILVGDF